MLHLIYCRPKGEKLFGDIRRYGMLYVGKGEKKKSAPAKSLPPDQKSLAMKILRAHLVSHSYVKCLDCNYQSLHPLSDGWIFLMVVYNPFGMKGHRYLMKIKFKIISEKKVSC